MSTFEAFWSWVMSMGPRWLATPIFLFVVHVFVYWAYSAFYLFVDVYRPSALYRYKVQKEQVSKERMWECAKTVLFNQFCLLPPMTLFFELLFIWRGTTSALPFPSTWVIFRDLLVFALAYEVGFYYSHRLLVGFSLQSNSFYLN